MRKILFITLLLLLPIFFIDNAMYATNNANKLIIVVVPGFSIDDLKPDNASNNLCKNNYLGLMNTYAHKTKNNTRYLNIYDENIKQILTDNDIPYLLRKNNDYQSLLKETKSFIYQNTRCIVFLDLNDLNYLDTNYQDLTLDLYQEKRNLLMKKISSFLTNIINTADHNNACMLIVSPYPSIKDLKQRAYLTPLIYHVPNNNGGIISSNSTKQQGLSIIHDIPISILSFFNIPQPHSLTGSSLQFNDFNYPLPFLLDTYKNILDNNKQRPIILKGFVLIEIILVLSSLLLLLKKHPLLIYVHKILISYTSIPLLLLILPILPTSRIEYRLLFLLVGVLFFITLSFIVKNTFKYLSYLYLATTLFVLFDILNHSSLMKMSLLGYDPISGSRYYGLGNEYMGVLLGSSIMSIALLMERISIKKDLSKYTTILFFLFFIIITGIVALPQFGTNVGGSIAFCLTYLFYFMLIYKQDLNIKKLITASFICLGCLVILFVYDLHRPIETQSHIGMTARQIKQSGLLSLLPIFTRKITMNIKLIHYSIWSRVFITLLSAMTLLFYKPPGLVLNILSKYPILRKGFSAGVFGSIIVLIVNDSGIVAAATSMIYICSLFFCTIIISNI